MGGVVSRSVRTRQRTRLKSPNPTRGPGRRNRSSAASLPGGDAGLDAGDRLLSPGGRLSGDGRDPGRCRRGWRRPASSSRGSPSCGVRVAGFGRVCARRCEAPCCRWRWRGERRGTRGSVRADAGEPVVRRARDPDPGAQGTARARGVVRQPSSRVALAGGHGINTPQSQILTPSVGGYRAWDCGHGDSVSLLNNCAILGISLRQFPGL